MRVSQTWSHPLHLRLALHKELSAGLVFMWVDLWLGLVLGGVVCMHAGVVIDFAERQVRRHFGIRIIPYYFYMTL